MHGAAHGAAVGLVMVWLHMWWYVCMMNDDDDAGGFIVWMTKCAVMVMVVGHISQEVSAVLMHDTATTALLECIMCHDMHTLTPRHTTQTTQMLQCIYDDMHTHLNICAMHGAAVVLVMVWLHYCGGICA